MGSRTIDFEETDANYAIGWKGNYRIEGRHSSTSTKVRPDHHDPWLILPPKLRDWLNRKPVRHLPGKNANPRLAFRTKSQKLLQLTAAARNERSAVERKIPLPSQR